MNICERCGHEYRFFVDHGGHKLCHNCWDRCSICGQKLPMSNKIGATMTAGTALFTPMVMLPIAGKLERETKPWLGSGLCMNCYHAKEKKEVEEQELIKAAQLRQARDIIETPSTWDCPYCKAVNRGNFCQNCGSPRKRTESVEENNTDKNIGIEEIKFKDENIDEMIEKGYIFNVTTGKWEKPNQKKKA